MGIGSVAKLLLNKKSREAINIFCESADKMSNMSQKDISKNFCSNIPSVSTEKVLRELKKYKK